MTPTIGPGCAEGRHGPRPRRRHRALKFVKETTSPSTAAACRSPSSWPRRRPVERDAIAARSARASVRRAARRARDVDVTTTFVGAVGVGARARQAAAARRQERDRGRRRQGRRRQDHGVGQPGRRAVEDGRRVGILDGDIYGPNVPIMFGLQAQLESDGKKIRPGREVRHPGRVDGVPDAGRSAGDLARADAAQRHPAVLPRRGVEGPRLPDRRHAARHRRRGAVAQPDRAGRPARSS